MKIFFDENFSAHLTRGFAAFQDGRPEEDIEVLHVADVFGRGAPDEMAGRRRRLMLVRADRIRYRLVAFARMR